MSEQKPSKSDPITKDNIGKICQKYGFVYEEEGGKHFATVGDEKIEVTFNTDGNLPKGRNKFINAARSASPDFLTAYPPKGKSGRESARGEANDPSLPRIDVRLLRKYTMNQVRNIRKYCDQVLAEMECLKVNASKIAEFEDRIEMRSRALTLLRKSGSTLSKALKEELSSAKDELKELKKPKS